MTLRVLGCGDVFGSGGRFHTSFYLDAGETRLLIDCGTTALMAMHRYRLDPAGLDGIVLSHLHGDHFGGLPFFLLDAAFVSRRRTPLVVAGPVGTLQRLRRATEVLFPGFWASRGRRQIEVLSLRDRRPTALGGATITPFRVVHDSGAAAFALQVSCNGCTVGYSGDTAWTPALMEAAADTDLFLCEATSFRRPLPFHLAYERVAHARAQFRTARLMLTHLGPEMVARAAGLAIESVRDGQRIRVAGRKHPGPTPQVNRPAPRTARPALSGRETE